MALPIISAWAILYTVPPPYTIRIPRWYTYMDASEVGSASGGCVPWNLGGKGPIASPNNFPPIPYYYPFPKVTQENPKGNSGRDFHWFLGWGFQESGVGPLEESRHPLSPASPPPTYPISIGLWTGGRDIGWALPRIIEIFPSYMGPDPSPAIKIHEKYRIFMPLYTQDTPKNI